MDDKNLTPKQEGIATLLATLLIAVGIGAAFFWSDIKHGWRSMTEPGYVERAAAQEAEKAAKAKWEKRLSSAHYSCKKAVRERSKFPTKASFDTGFDEMIRNLSAPIGSKAVTFRGRVNLMNGFGAMIPHRYSCVVDMQEWKLVDVTISEG